MPFPLSVCVLLAQALVPAQGPYADPAEYVRAHRAADLALQQGDLEAAREGFRRCLKLSPENSSVAYGLACVESRAGSTVTALDWLGSAVAWGYSDPGVVTWDEDLAGLRTEERFVAAIEAMREKVAENAETQPVRLVLPNPLGVRPKTCAIDPSGGRVLVGYDDGSLAVLGAITGQVSRHMKPFRAGTWATAFSPDGSCFAALAHDGTLGIWKVREEDPVILATAMRAPMAPIDRWRETFGDEVEPVPDLLEALGAEWPFGAFLQFDPTGERLLVAGRDLGGSLWTRGGECLHRWEDALGGSFRVPLAWSPDGERIAWASDSDVSFFDGRSGEQFADYIASPSPVNCLDFHPSGASLATGHEDGTVRLWQVSDRVLVWENRLEPESLPFFPIGPLRVSSIAQSADGMRLAYATGPDACAIVLDVESGAHVWTSGFGGGRMGEHVPVRWSTDGSRLWFAFASGVMALRTVQPAEGAEARIVCDGFVPSIGAPEGSSAGIGATIIDSVAVAVLDDHDSYVRWMRTEAQGGIVLQAHTGHFTTEIDSFDGWTISRGYRAEPEDLVLFIERLFDPKRVRASQAGVRLVPAD